MSLIRTPIIAPILAVETAAAQCGVAILRDDGRIFSIVEPRERGQAERLLPLVKAILQEAGIQMPQLGGIAVTTGPGSFTGVRVGLATAQGLAMALDIPAIGIASTLAFRESAPADPGQILVAVESRRHEVYWQAFAGREPVSEIFCQAPEDIPGSLETFPALICGDAATRLAAYFPRVRLMPLLPGPRPENVARLALLANGNRTSLAPLYVRPPDATISHSGGPSGSICKS